MNSTRSMKKPVFGLIALLLCVPLAFAGLNPKDKGQGVQKTGGDDLYRPFLINNVFNYYGNNGDGAYNKFSASNEGFEFFKGSGKTCIFEEGVVWGGYHKGYTTKDKSGNVIPQAKVGGSVYRHGISAGPILQYGTATTDPVGDDPTSPLNRIYRVRPDINPSTPFADVQAKIQAEEVAYIGRYESYSAQDIYNQYINDWNQWPAAEGAPFTYGKDAQGVQRVAPAPYDPAYDIPGQPGSDQTLWYVANDANPTRTAYLAGSPVIGLEMRRTIWGYKRKGALGQTIFESSVLINKSGAKVDTMYLVQWTDPDLGDGGDDYCGCDTTRSLGFVYNAKSSDAVFGTAIPAAGFDFFQGPILPGAPSDTAIFMLKKRGGYKNMPMTTFDFFISTIAAYTDPVQGAGGDIQWYHLMNATIAASGAPFIDPTTNQPTKFCLYGDPTKSTNGGAGWVDGMNGLTPADRRFCLVTGPFTMAPGDTQELVVALLGGLGADYLSSITALKGIDDKAQSAYNSLFALPSPPPAPVVSVAALDGEIVLSWGDDVTIAKTEGGVSQGFTFEGYNVYEFPGPSNTGAILLGTYDLNDGVKVISDTAFDPPTGLNLIQVLQMGTDNGIVHSIDLQASKVTGSRLINGTSYYFGVTAYSYNSNPPAAAGTHSLESSPSILTIVPHSANPGTRYSKKVGDGIKATLTTAAGAGASDGSVTAVVVDPNKLSGDTYKVTFSTDTTSGNTVWAVTDVTKGVVKTKNQTNQSGDANYPIVDGMQIRVLGPPPGMKTGDQYLNPGDTASWGWWIPSGARRWSPSGSDNANSFHLEGFTRGGLYNGAIGNAYDHWYSGSTVGYDKLTNVLIKFAATDSTWNVATTPTDANFSLSYRYVRHATDTSTFAANPSWRTGIPNKSGGYAYQDYVYGVPFSAWNVDANPPVRLAVGHLENNAAGGMLDYKWWPPAAATTSDNALTAREWWFIFATPYTTTPDPALQQDILDVTLPIMWCGIPDITANYAAGDQFMIATNHVNGAAHTFSWTVPATIVGDPLAAKLDVTKVNVFPNPYIGFNPQEINKYARFVTFNHLPTSATIRIFTLSGTLVRTLVKNDPSQFYQWDLNNEKGFPVGAGMYIVYIDMQNLGTKTLKLGVIPEQQYLDRW